MTADENILCEHVVNGGSVKIRAYGNYFIWAYRGESKKWQMAIISYDHVGMTVE